MTFKQFKRVVNKQVKGFSAFNKYILLKVEKGNYALSIDWAGYKQDVTMFFQENINNLEKMNAPEDIKKIWLDYIKEKELFIKRKTERTYKKIENLMY